MTTARPDDVVIVGAGQFLQSSEDPVEPITLLARASLTAIEDCDVAGVAKAITHAIVIRIMSWRYRDPGRMLMHELGSDQAIQSYYTTPGGQSPMASLGFATRLLQEDPSAIVLIGGAEASKSRAKLGRIGQDPDWSQLDDSTSEGECIGDPLDMASQLEMDLGLFLPINTYALVEDRLRRLEGRSTSEHQKSIAELWSRFSKVAESNRFAAIRDRYQPHEILQLDERNRMVSTPYTKLLCSNSSVDMASAFLVTSQRRASELGIEADRMIYPHALASGHDPNYLSERWEISRSPAIRHCGEAIMEATGRSASDVDLIDLYSCFPSAVEVAARELGFDLAAKVPTVTGGLTFSGGPWNNYVSHSISTTVELLRKRPNAVAMLTANGGILSKHCITILSAQPPERRVQLLDVQARIDNSAHRRRPSKECTMSEVEASTVQYSSAGRVEIGYLFAKSKNGIRSIGRSVDPTQLLILEATKDDPLLVSIDSSGTVIDLTTV